MKERKRQTDRKIGRGRERKKGTIDAHELKIQGRFLPKSLLDSKAFRRNYQGGSPYFGFNYNL
jgi:hypothetical protein